MPKRIFVLIYTVFIATHCYAKYDFLLHKSYAERYRAIDSLFYYNTELRSDKNAFFKELELLAKDAQKGDDLELLCETRLLSLAFNSTNDKYRAFDKVEPEAFEVIKIAQKNKLTQIEIRCRQFLGRYYMEKAGKYLQSIDQFLTSYYLIQHLSTEEFPTKKEHLYNVAHAYYNFGDFESAKKYLMEADKSAMPNGMTMLDDKNKIFTFISLENTLGLIYRNEKKFDTAINYFIVVRELAAKYNDSVWMGIASGNMGITYYIQGRYPEAIPLLNEDIYHSFKGGQIDNGVNSLIKLTDIYLASKDYKNVKVLIDSARRMLSMTMEPAQHMQYLCPVMAKYYSETGNMALAYLYLDSARIAKEEMDLKKNNKALAVAEQRIELQKHTAELQQAEDEKRLQILRRNSIIAGIILVASIIILIINGQKRAYRQKTKYAEAEKVRAEQDLKNAESQLQDFKKNIHDKNELIERISAEMERYQAIQDNVTVTANNEVILELQRSILLTDEQWEQFKLNFEKVHSGFLVRLREKLPDLTPAETRFMALAKLKLSNKEMAGMLGVSMQGVRNYRYRLRKKLNLPEEGSIDELVNSI